MSYARFGWDGSHVYVYCDVNGYLACCGCRLGDKWAFYSTDDMIAHLREHLEAGHTVPDDLIPALQADRDENDAFIEQERDRASR